MSVTMYVTYAGQPDARFDRQYWINKHFPLVRNIWEPYGMEDLSAFFPAEDKAGVIAICPVKFRDEDGLRAALKAPETKAVMDDIVNFTELTSSQALAKSI